MKEKEYMKPLLMDVSESEMLENFGLAAAVPVAIIPWVLLVAGVYTVVGAAVLLVAGGAVSYAIGASKVTVVKS